MNAIRSTLGKTLPLAFACIVAGTLAYPCLAADPGDIDFGVRAGYYFDAGGPLVGAELLADIGNKADWYFNPNVEFAFGDDADVFTINGDFHYDFHVDTPFYLWAGGGPAVLWTNPDVGDSDTDFGVNALVGIGQRSGAARFFGQIKAIIANDSELALAVGVRF